MNRPTIKAPINSLESAKMQIRAGAGEIYGGYLSNKITNLSFSGRGKEDYNKIKTHMNYEEFKEIIKYAHENKVKVEFTANVPMTGDDPDGGDFFQRNYLEYVRKAVEAGVDRVIVGDIGNIMYLRENNITIPITSSTFLGTMNSQQVVLLERLGVNKVVLPHHMKFEEIAKIRERTNIEIEIFGHFGCSFIESTCSMYHHASEDINLGIPCRGCYNICGSDKELNILDTGEDCSLCSLPQIMESGVDSIKIIGRELDYKFTSSITFIYNYVMSRIEAGKKIHCILEEVKSKYDFDFWEKNFCKSNRCKYLNTKYYI